MSYLGLRFMMTGMKVRWAVDGLGKACLFLLTIMSDLRYCLRFSRTWMMRALVAFVS
jgi:hypothetical protein